MLLVGSGIESELIEPFEVATPVGDFVIAMRAYRNWSVVIYSRRTIANLIELNMIEFDIIVGMDCWLLVMLILIAEER